MIQNQKSKIVTRRTILLKDNISGALSEQCIGIVKIPGVLSKVFFEGEMSPRKSGEKKKEEELIAGYRVTSKDPRATVQG